MPWKRLKRSLFRLIGPKWYQVVHAIYFFTRLFRALQATKYAQGFFGADLQAFAACLKPGDRVLDIGAFLGASTVLFANAVGKSGLVLAFEPVHGKLLKRVLFPFRLRQVSLQPIGVGAENISTDFLIPIYFGVPLYSQSGFSNSYAAENIGPGYSFQKRRVEIIRLDDFLARQNLAPESIAAVKIDVEGSEMSLFAGGENFFQRFQGLLLCEFWFNQVPPPGWTWLREQGYLCRYLGKNGQWLPANTSDEMREICHGETYGNFFFSSRHGHFFA